MKSQKPKVNFKSIPKTIFNLFVDISIFLFFATLFLSLTYLLTPQLVKLPSVFNYGWIFGGMFLLIKSLFINWSFLK